MIARFKIAFLLAGGLFLAGLFLAGCAAHSTPQKDAVFLSIKSPIIRLAEAGFVSYKNGGDFAVQIYAAGVSVMELKSSGDKICLNGACEGQKSFNERFFGARHYDGLLGDIVFKRAIFDGRGKINGGKIDASEIDAAGLDAAKFGEPHTAPQSSTATEPCEISQQTHGIIYSVCGGAVSFSDAKRGVKITLKRLK